MLKINPIVPKTVRRYCSKNTVNARYERNMDLAVLSGLGLTAQVFRLPSWNMPDVGITAFLGTSLFHGLIQAMKHKKDLAPIVKRAKVIKMATKL